MKKWTAWFVLVFLAVPVVANATHVSEPTAPITALDLHLENYAAQVPVDCTGTTPYAFDKVRVAMYITAVSVPSEHFEASYRVFWQSRTSKGLLVWNGDDDPSWPHQNMGPHAVNGKFDASRLSDVNGLLLPRPNATGVWRVNARLVGDESGTALADSCTFKVAA